MQLTTNTKIVLGLAVFVVLAAVIPEIGKKPKYPYWSSAFHLEITQTLVKRKIRGCGEYQFKSDGRGNSKFLVRCTRDGENWVLYQVDTSKNRVSGPL